jgi:nicotinate phosphoribosyltransferase
VNGLTTDLYHVDAAYVSWRAGLNGIATFDLYTRSHPFGGGFLLTAGLEAAIQFIQGFGYAEDDLAFLAGIKPYDPAFLAELGRLRFTGDVLAMPEGTVAFAPAPLLRVTAPFREALLLESGLLHAIGRASLIATKAARVVLAAQGRPVTEFALRRAAEPLLVARSAAIGGCAATSYVAAARAFALPAAGTIPHALIQLFPSEAEAFRAVAQALDPFTLLLDTYNPRRAIHSAVAVAREASERWRHRLAAVRLDSGDLVADSRYVRDVLDAVGLTGVQVLVSGDLDEYRIDALLRDGAPIDGFGVGTSVGVGAGSVERGIEGGALGAVYKLVWYDDHEPTTDDARIKLAGAKSTWPGVKQVYRHASYAGDLIQLASEPPPPDSAPLLVPVVRASQPVAGTLPSLSEIRRRASLALATLPAPYRALEHPTPYPIAWSPALQAIRHRASQNPWQAPAPLPDAGTGPS